MLMEAPLLTEARNMVDNFDAIGNLINLTDSDKFFFVQIIKRYKDNKDKAGYDKRKEDNYHAGGSYGVLIKGTAFKVHNKQELMALKPKITAYCDANNARAYITSNPRSESTLNNYLPTYLKKQARRNGGIVPDYDKNYGFEHIAGQCKDYDPINFPDYVRFFLDVDTLANAYYIPKSKQMRVDSNSGRVNDPNVPQLRACEATFNPSGSLLLLPKYPNQEQFIKQYGGLNVWDETRNILKNNNIPIEMEYKTPSKGLHIVIADVRNVSSMANLKKDLSIFDDGKDMGRVQLVHANMDGKLILYSNVDTAGY